MRFEEALANFKNEIAKEYGTFDGLVKIGIEPDLFSKIMLDLHKVGVSYSRFEPSKMGEVKLLGVQLLARRKDDF